MSCRPCSAFVGNGTGLRYIMECCSVTLLRMIDPSDSLLYTQRTVPLRSTVCTETLGIRVRIRRYGWPRRFYWPGMEADIEKRVIGCLNCVCRKTPTKPMAALLPIKTSRPVQLVCIDFLKVDVSKGGYENILVITDHFTRFPKAISCKKITAQVTAKALYENFIVHFSFPEQLHIDQGCNFDYRLIKSLCELASVKKTRTTPYHPCGNGGAERFNRTLLKMLGTMTEDQKRDWPSF